MLSLKDRYRGLILGTAVGDSIGLPAEGISRMRAGKMFNGRWRLSARCWVRLVQKILSGSPS